MRLPVSCSSFFFNNHCQFQLENGHEDTEFKKKKKKVMIPYLYQCLKRDLHVFWRKNSLKVSSHQKIKIQNSQVQLFCSCPSCFLPAQDCQQYTLCQPATKIIKGKYAKRSIAYKNSLLITTAMIFNNFQSIYLIISRSFKTVDGSYANECPIPNYYYTSRLFQHERIVQQVQ